MQESLLDRFGVDSNERVKNAIKSLHNGGGVLVVDDENRENEGDLVFPAETVSESQMATLIRECSGIVCLCLTEDKVKELGLQMMVENNSSWLQTAYTVSIEAAEGVTTGVSAADRLATVRTASAVGAKPTDLRKPGHVFPLKARKNGVFDRRGHTEATVDLMRIAGMEPCGVLCELTNPDGTMARLPELAKYAQANSMPLVTIEDLVGYRQLHGV